MLGTIAVLAAGCGQDADRASRSGRDADESTTRRRCHAAPTRPLTPSPDRSGSPPTPQYRRPATRRRRSVRAEWSKAANRATCAPLALKSDARPGGKPRAATFSGGWAVAFDQPDRRSAYGFAGVGALPEDRAGFRGPGRPAGQAMALRPPLGRGPESARRKHRRLRAGGRQGLSGRVVGLSASSRSPTSASPASNASTMSGASSAATISSCCSTSSR